jgi:DNA-binding NarL/FixJ family response regulator
VISALVIADSPTVMAAIAASLCRLDDVDIVAHASGRAPAGAIVRALVPDLVLVDEMDSVDLALTRVAEIRAAHPLAVILGVAERPDSQWVVTGMGAGAAAVVPRELEPATLQLVLDEALRTASVLGACCSPTPVTATPEVGA